MPACCRPLRLPGNGPTGTVDVVFGRVVAIHIDDAFLRADGRLDIERIRPLARMGYHDYTSVEHVFTMTPRGSPARFAGLEGSPEKMDIALQGKPPLTGTWPVQHRARRCQSRQVRRSSRRAAISSLLRRGVRFG